MRRCIEILIELPIENNRYNQITRYLTICHRFVPLSHSANKIRHIYAVYVDSIVVERMLALVEEIRAHPNRLERWMQPMSNRVVTNEEWRVIWAIDYDMYHRSRRVEYRRIDAILFRYPIRFDRARQLVDPMRIPLKMFVTSRIHTYQSTGELSCPCVTNGDTLKELVRTTL